MKRFRYYILVIISALFLSACGVMKQTSIEVLKPAKMIVPPHIQKVVLVDNTKKQPAHIGNNSYVIFWKKGELMKVLDGTDTINVDSLGASVVFNTANTLFNTGYYDTIMVWPRNTANLNIEWTEQRLSSSEIFTIANTTGADAVYSLDVYTYENSFNVYMDQFNTVSDVYVDVKARALWRFYDVKKRKSLQHQIVLDSIHADGEIYYYDFGLPSNEVMLLDMAWKMGETSANVMSPTWKTVNRVYFDSGSAEFKIANKQFERNNLDEFRDQMLPLFEHGKRKIKARAAFNLAFYSELTDQLDEAIRWIDESDSIYTQINSSGLYDEEVEMVKVYRKVLEVRINEKKELAKQL